MRTHRFVYPLLAFCLSLFIGVDSLRDEKPKAAVDNDWFMLQRVFPFDDIPAGLYEKAKADMRAIAQTQNLSTAEVQWESVGPSNIGGRITALAVHPTNSNILYAGAAAGGVWKSIDGGATWTSIFNESPSIGSLLLDPLDPEIIYVGTGEGNPGGVAIYPGNGMWRSTDGGQSWSQRGLANVGQIGRLTMNAAAPGRIFAAALGLYRSRTTDRGVYRSTDAGLTWERKLYLNDTTGACAVLMDPVNPDRVYAVMWTRYRPMTYSVITSPNTGLWLSTDGGNTWNQVTNGFPFNDGSLGRTSLAVSQSHPGIVYALASSGTGVRGIYRSTDSGVSWLQVATSGAFNSEPQVWYNNVITVDPTNPDILFVGMTRIYKSTNGGVNWTNVTGTMHVDNHAILFDPGDPQRLIVGNDGGVFVSTNQGSTWIKSFNLPVSQFYAGTIDYSNPQRYYGGMQDNGTARTMTGSTNDWNGIYGGDGFYVVVDPVNPSRVYAESQNGGLARSTNGGTSFTSATSGISPSDRKNWSTPFVLDWNTPLTLYTGTHRMYRTTNGMQNWSVMSGDLTRGPNGRLGTITTIDVAQSNSSVIAAGTDDGKISITTDGGTSWVDVTGNLPVRWVTRVAFDPDSANILYVTQSGYLEYTYQSHIHRSVDYGQTWTPVHGNLPNLPINDIIIDQVARPLLYIATDLGVLYSTNHGNQWSSLGVGLPEVPVHDLTYHPPTRKLLASTHGRSAYLTDVSLLTDVAESNQDLPTLIRLDQNFPNPFNPSTRIHFTMARAAHVELRVFDVQGRTVRTLLNGEMGSGGHTYHFDASNLAAGVYFYRLSAGKQSAVQKMLLVK